MLKKVLGVAVLAALSLASFATPAFAARSQGGADTIVLNPGGGRLANGSDGIVIIINGLDEGAWLDELDGNPDTDPMEVTEDGSDQVYFAQVPQWCCGGVGPVLNIGGTAYGEAGAASYYTEASWDSITVVSTTGARQLIANGSLDGITATLKGNATAEILYSVSVDTLIYTVRREITYTYPNSYYDEVWTVTIPAGNMSEVDFYLGGDAAPGGTDDGTSEMVTLGGKIHLREKNVDSGQYISYQETSASSPFDYYFVGNYSDPYTNVSAGTNLTNEISSEPGHDAGIQIQWSFGTASGSYERVMRTKIGFNNEFELAATGVDAAGLALGGFALLCAGAVVVVRRRNHA